MAYNIPAPDNPANIPADEYRKSPVVRPSIHSRNNSRTSNSESSGNLPAIIYTSYDIII